MRGFRCLQTLVWGGIIPSGSRGEGRETETETERETETETDTESQAYGCKKREN